MLATLLRVYSSAKRTKIFFVIFAILATFVLNPFLPRPPAAVG
jgi:hypothetical protein